MSPDISIDRLRSQRNLAMVAAFLLVVLPTALVTPGFVHRYRQVKAEQVELVRLQATISSMQFAIRYDQARIIATQDEIRALQHAPH